MGGRFALRTSSFSSGSGKKRRGENYLRGKLNKRAVKFLSLLSGRFLCSSGTGRAEQQQQQQRSRIAQHSGNAAALDSRLFFCPRFPDLNY